MTTISDSRLRSIITGVAPLAQWHSGSPGVYGPGHVGQPTPERLVSPSACRPPGVVVPQPGPSPSPPGSRGHARRSRVALISAQVVVTSIRTSGLTALRTEVQQCRGQPQSLTRAPPASWLNQTSGRHLRPAVARLDARGTRVVLKTKARRALWRPDWAMRPSLIPEWSRAADVFTGAASGGRDIRVFRFRGRCVKDLASRRLRCTQIGTHK
jgi:hypothetical protein